MQEYENISYMQGNAAVSFLDERVKDSEQEKIKKQKKINFRFYIK